VKPISLNLPENYIKKLDQLVKEKYYPNRAEAIRLAIHDLLHLHENLRRMINR